MSKEIICKATGQPLRLMDVKRNFSAKGTNYYEGERKALDAETAARWCVAGWLSDPAGELETGTPDTSPKELEIQNGTHASRATTKI